MAAQGAGGSGRGVSVAQVAEAELVRRHWILNTLGRQSSQDC